ncbi:MAG: EamA family transporter [Synergistaceae bacterium]|jgi:transporter family protein|nr:EamA family transporter [Synergistaceae bacterium]
MWILFAFGSAFFAGITSILAKYGMKEIESRVATAVRTTVVFFFSCAMVWFTGSWAAIAKIDAKNFVFLVSSGFATGASWLCYFHALHIGEVGKVVAIDKSSTVLTMLMAFILLGESVTAWGIFCIGAIAAGTYLMVRSNVGQPIKKRGDQWFLYASLSAVFASLTPILGKVGIQNIDSNVGTTVRTAVVLLMAWGIVLFPKKRYVLKVSNRDILFLCLSGVATGASWLCFYKALRDGPASVVIPVDKLSILITIGFAYIVFGEILTKRSLLGLVLIVSGTLALLI